MQKLLSRTAYAERMAARKLKKEEAARRLADKMEYMRHQKQGQYEIRQQRTNARTARREEWLMGPLAPRRDTAYGKLGELETVRMTPRFDLPRDALEAVCKWAGGPDRLCLAVGDRVVVTEGPLKGRISKVRSITVKTGVLELETEGWANIEVPSFYLSAENPSMAQPMPTSIPISAVRLVHPLPNPSTGAIRDVVIRELRPAGPHAYDPTYRDVVFDRVVPGLNVRIPWPDRQAPTYEEFAGDTPRLHAEARTFVPTLLSPPMPEAVVDELRNKYSRFRTRHEPEYVARKAEEFGAKKTRESMTDMRTPLEEFHLADKARRRARGQPVLTEEMLEKIGEVIARNKQRMLQAGGMTEDDTGLTDGIGAGGAEVPLPPPEETVVESRPPPS